jgi:hypothetical protein
MQRLSLTAAALAALLIGCDVASDPAAPPSDPVTWNEPYAPGGGSSNLSIAGFVIDESEQCIIGALVQVVDGPRKGASFVQTVCGFWDYGENLGYSFHGLPGQPVTLRATAEGYRTAEVVGTPTNPFQYRTFIILTKSQ